MKASEICNVANATVLSGEHMLDTEIKSAFASDMMSDVLAFAEDQTILITGLVNPQTVRTAMMLDIKCILFVRGKKPDDSVVSLAEENGIIVLATDLKMYSVCGKLYNAGRASKEVCV